MWSEIFGPRGELASTAYLIDAAGTGPHVVATRFEVTVNGELVFSKNFGAKTGLTTLHVHAERSMLPEGARVITLTAADRSTAAGSTAPPECSGEIEMTI